MSNAAVERDRQWIWRFRPAPAAPAQLVCFPHAGGSAGYFLPMVRALTPSLDVLCVQYPGRQDRSGEAPVEDVHELADLVSAELRPWIDHRPLTLFGHSLGASVAFEVAVRLEGAGTEVSGLIASGRRAPSRTRPDRVHERDDRALIAELERLAGTDTRMLRDPDIVRMVLPSLRSDYKAAETYRCRPGASRISAPLLVLTGDADPQVTADEAADWAAHTSGSCTLSTHPGGHFFLTEHPAEVNREIDAFARVRTSQGDPA
ncbi:alpha/beta fold hydrolase [Streptomyces sp. AM 4-1-1]|uniref:thioesterase II family protein n=1 Tax=Streptomyces sp. AM 4-1-1 TaxID=3028710 RepID=UPI0023B9776C|nr:alpha/beta fold hydrolase [Streptomyces sp. AM 4-1-1]WEH35873.1 alpha/beta fold hydrolase [Streptomyces sp. AM 4-1-1]